MPQENIQEAANKHYASRFDADERALITLATGYDDDDTIEYEGETLDREQAIERLQESILSFERTVTDHRHESIQWEILLGTGGPADRVVVTTDYSGTIESAVYEYQDWFQPWTEAEGQDSDLVESFAAIVGYYEDAREYGPSEDHYR